jgi:antitoxin ParD1/3/4
MRTNIVIDDKLMAAAMEAGGFSTKKEAVEEGLRLLARRKAYQRLLALGGQLQWAGDDSVDWTIAAADAPAVQEPPAQYVASATKKPRPARRTR